MQSQAARESGLGRATKEVRRREDDPRNVGDMAVDRDEEAPVTFKDKLITIESQWKAKVQHTPRLANMVGSYGVGECRGTCGIASIRHTAWLGAGDGEQNRRRFITRNDDRRVRGPCPNQCHGPTLSNLKEILRMPVGLMMGNNNNNMGLTEKVVLSDGRVCALKRFQNVRMMEREFGRRVERLAHVCNNSDYLVPITAYLYPKRIKLVLCDYYPMGSLADLLSGGRRGQTALNWNQRLRIIICIARAIDFIHAQLSPNDQNNMRMNVRGNIKSSNIIENTDFTARLSDYGFLQLTDHCTEGSDHQVLTGVSKPGHVMFIRAAKVMIRQGKIMFLEFDARGIDRKQALMVLDINCFVLYEYVAGGQACNRANLDHES
ncbi:hypothetical protein Goshw_029434 [Gossypium schwendimanii]|uniref:Protein kinase domain-containing protein n=1 Tax=Gossypium schwendimanii TaxID=34291 RepID=A0A7J9LTJ4_GOSSC|nr:hypothetical protein [Gossypium schwendimanii]